MATLAVFDENSSMEINLLTLRKKLFKDFRNRYFDDSNLGGVSSTIVDLNKIIKDRRPSDDDLETIIYDINSGKDDDNLADEEANIDRVQILTPDDQEFYKKYFAIRLRMTRERGIHPFLEYQLKAYYEGNLVGMKYLISDLFEDYNLWFKDVYKHKEEVDSFFENKSTLNEGKKVAGWEEEAKNLLKKTPTRAKGDKLTSLSATSTAALFNFLREEDIILKNESYLESTKLIIAISILTGYRGNLGKELNKQEYPKTILKQLKLTLLKVIKLIDNELYKK